MLTSGYICANLCFKIILHHKRGSITDYIKSQSKFLTVVLIAFWDLSVAPLMVPLLDMKMTSEARFVNESHPQLPKNLP